MTRMARLAATEYGADWVINSDADEFWWPRGASLAEVLAAVPPRYGTVGAFLRVFCPRPGEEHFAERMTVRFSALAPINDPASLYKPIRKIVHRGHPEIQVDARQPCAVDSPFAPLRGLVPDRVLPLPPALGGPVRAQGGAPGRGIREAHRAAPDRLPRGHVRGAPGRPDRRVLRGARRLGRGAGAGRRRGQARRRHAAPRRAPRASRSSGAGICRPETLRRFASRSRRSSTTPSTRSRRRCSARPTWSGSSAGSTSSSAGSGRVEQRLPTARVPEAPRTAKRVSARTPVALGARLQRLQRRASRPARRRSPRRGGRGPRAPPGERSEAASP